jgi:hypothetical protein
VLALLTLLALDVQALTPFAPATLAGGSRENLFVDPKLQVIDARYRAGEREIHLNLNPVKDVASATAFYRQYPTKTASHHMRVHQRHNTTKEGQTFTEACSLIRDAINVCVSVWPSTKEAEALKVLDAVDLPGLLALAIASGAPKPFPGDLTFKADAKGWKRIEESVRNNVETQMNACASTPRTPECVELAAAKKDCRPGRFEAGLLESDIELTDVERENFHRIWKITCKSYGAPVP